MNKLNNYLRQYRHNDNSDFVLGYEQKGTEVFVSWLEKEIADQNRKIEDKAKLIKGVDKANSEMALEIECLKKQVSQLKAENISIAAYADQRINMLTRANKKLGGEL